MTDATMAPTSLERDWMTPEEFRTWYDRLKRLGPKLTHAKLGEYLEVTQPTITKWLNGTRQIEHGAMLQLALERLEQKLIEEQKPKRVRRQQRQSEAERS